MRRTTLSWILNLLEQTLSPGLHLFICLSKSMMQREASPSVAGPHPTIVLLVPLVDLVPATVELVPVVVLDAAACRFAICRADRNHQDQSEHPTESN